MAELGKSALSMANVTSTKFRRERGISAPEAASIQSSRPTSLGDDISQSAQACAASQQSPASGIVSGPEIDARSGAFALNEVSTREILTSDMGKVPAYSEIRSGTSSDNYMDWLNFDAAFENMDALLGSSGADLCMELLRPFCPDAEGHEGNQLLSSSVPAAF